MILDKLMEKKDVLLFLVGRVAILQDEKKKAAGIKNVDRREVAIKQIQGRILEVGYMKKVIEADSVRMQSKAFWKMAARKGVLMKGR